MLDFWNRSWAQVDMARIEGYVAASSEETQEVDAILGELVCHGAKKVCDAGCGCGAYTVKLAQKGFQVSGFDVFSRAVEIASSLLHASGCSAELKTASVLATGYGDREFDGVVCLDVLDHMGKADAQKAVQELVRITIPGGILLFTLDACDEEYKHEPHFISDCGDFVYTDGKWAGMVFHPYSRDTLCSLIPHDLAYEVRESGDGLLVMVKK